MALHSQAPGRLFVILHCVCVGSGYCKQRAEYKAPLILEENDPAVAEKARRKSPLIVAETKSNDPVVVEKAHHKASLRLAETKSDDAVVVEIGVNGPVVKPEISIGVNGALLKHENPIGVNGPLVKHNAGASGTSLAAHSMNGGEVAHTIVRTAPKERRRSVGQGKHPMSPGIADTMRRKSAGQGKQQKPRGKQAALFEAAQEEQEEFELLTKQKTMMTYAAGGLFCICMVCLVLFLCGCLDSYLPDWLTDCFKGERQREREDRED